MCLFIVLGNRPTKLHDRSATLNGCQIINVRTDSTGDWSCVVGIMKDPSTNLIVGRFLLLPLHFLVHILIILLFFSSSNRMQLYCNSKKQDQTFNGHCCAFLTRQLQGNPNPTTLFAFADRSGGTAKLKIFEAQAGGPKKWERKTVDIYFPAEATQDFPVAMQVSTYVMFFQVFFFFFSFFFAKFHILIKQEIFCDLFNYQVRLHSCT